MGRSDDTVDTELPPIGAAATQPSARADVAARPAVVGRYRITGTLGAGGMGTVYAAYDPQLDRELAIKLLLPRGVHDADAQARFAREARALARISHPNVVAVFDVGTHDGQIFIAMERIAGGTLRAWLAEQPRNWREVVAMYAAAGRGLASVHSHGLVHRDFKPDNVLVDRERPRVGDFGLVAVAGDRTEAPATASALASPLTVAGQIMGTPAYMAPEQLAGHRVDARSDQFSFCVSLYEALYAQRPFTGDSLESLSAAVNAGAVRPVPDRSRVPGWLRAAVLRGLAADPARRYPSMVALVAAIERDPARTRRRWIGGIAIAASLVVGGWYRGARDAQHVPCESGARALAGAWDGERRAAIAARFRGLGDDAPSLGARVTRQLDIYATRWRASHDAACHATHTDRTQSLRALDLRMACLAVRKRELATVATQLAQVDAAYVDGAIAAVHAMSSLAPCDDITALEQIVPPPTDPAARAQVDALHARLIEARTKIGLSPADGVVAELRPLVAEAIALAYPPLTARAQLVLATALDRVGAQREAETAYRAAAAAADAGSDDRTRFEAWVELISLLALDAGRGREARELLPVAEATLARTRGDADLRLQFDLAVATVELVDGAPRDAATGFEQLMSTIEARHGADDERLATAAAGYANALQRFATPAEVEAAFRKAHQIRARAVGTGEAERRAAQVKAAQARMPEGMALIDRGEHAAAIALLEPNVAELARLAGARHESVATGSELLGFAYADAGRLDEARAAHARALDIRRAVHGNASAAAASSLLELSRVAYKQRDFATATTHAREALALYEATGSTTKIGGAHLTLARALQSLGRHDDALPHATQAVELGDGRPWFASALTVLGDLEVARGDVERGIVTLERALALRDASDWDRVGAAQTRLVLARARARQGRKRIARQLAERAARDLDALGKAALAAEAHALVKALP